MDNEETLTILGMLFGGISKYLLFGAKITDPANLSPEEKDELEMLIFNILRPLLTENVLSILNNSYIELYKTTWGSKQETIQ